MYNSDEEIKQTVKHFKESGILLENISMAGLSPAQVFKFREAWKEAMSKIDIVDGDIVRLKSGGPAMTVSGFDPTGRACCIWIDEHNQHRDMYLSPAALKKVSSSPDLTTAPAESTPQQIGTGTIVEDQMVDASVLRKSLTNLGWRQQPASTLLDQWVLEGDSPHHPGDRVCLVIAKKQAEGQWRVSYNATVFPKLMSYNSPTLNQSVRSSLSALNQFGIEGLPWTDGSTYEPALAAAQEAIAKEAAAPSSTPDPTPIPVAKPKARARAAKVDKTATSVPPPWDTEVPSPPMVEEKEHVKRDTEVPSPPMVEEKEHVKMNGGYMSQFKYGKGHTMSGLDMIVEAAAHGAKVGVADEAGNATLGIAEAIFGEHYPEMAKTERGRTIMKGVAAGLTLVAADKYPELFGSMADGAKAGCAMVIEAAGRDLLQPELKKITPLVKQLAEVGASQMKSLV